MENIQGQRPEGRPDLVSRVFQIKLMELLKDIREEKYFGKVKECKICFKILCFTYKISILTAILIDWHQIKCVVIYTIEFQK